MAIKNGLVAHQGSFEIFFWSFFHMATANLKRKNGKRRNEFAQQYCK